MSDYNGYIDLAFTVENLGSVKSGEFRHRPLTVFCGPNNTGKTWTMYSLYQFYRYAYELYDEFTSESDIPFDNERLSNGLAAMRPDFFNSTSFYETEDYFGLTYKADLDKALSLSQDSNAFLMPAERSGLNLLYRELNTRRTSLLHHASRGNVDVTDLLRDVIYSRYAEPIADYLDWLNSLPEIKAQGLSFEFQHFARQVNRGLVRGSYRVDNGNGSIDFRPYRTAKRIEGEYPSNTQTLGLHVTSSAVKSLFGLWFYLAYQAIPGQILMIDEPELNLHPGKQRQLARLLARLVNSGINVVISTHSDYIVRELNFLIMLNTRAKPNRPRWRQYRAEDLLPPEMVGAYLFDRNTITPMLLTEEDGIYAETFDDVIRSMNDQGRDIYFS